jgi:hypothetical protein
MAAMQGGGEQALNPPMPPGLIAGAPITGPAPKVPDQLAAILQSLPPEILQQILGGVQQ